ncbi:STAS domain-containing protein [Actinoplanes couchii]|uniref:MlaB-like STAS domain-containing protein n=1 Tax=Actinoplanes couchii TaxID=403638 RepID=A0ABQ3X1D4_9ACTN|nr:STAS domain-containing protein [Actinoplanes couchii]MDR6316716.1 hypothetical protein [Actinoplanes couchii]GID52325.1 hypothetical protein Aco03nite_007290 [Actinoplanes couchii]
MAYFVVPSGLRRTDIPVLCADLAGRLPAGPGGIVECDVAGADPGVVTVEALARLRLTARRHGCRLTIRNAQPALRELIIMLGLDGPLSVQPLRQASVEPLRQAEHREQAGGVEEVVD